MVDIKQGLQDYVDWSNQTADAIKQPIQNAIASAVNSTGGSQELVQQSAITKGWLSTEPRDYGLGPILPQNRTLGDLEKENTDQTGTLQAFEDATLNTLGKPFMAVAMAYMYNTAPKDPNFQVFKDYKPLMERGPDFLEQFGYRFAGSPNEEWARMVLHRIDEEVAIGKELQNKPVTNFVSTLLGSSSNPLMFTPVASGLVGGALSGAAIGAGFAATEMVANPTYTPEDAELSIAATAVTGGLIGRYVAMKNPPREISRIADNIKQELAQPGANYSKNPKELVPSKADDIEDGVNKRSIGASVDESGYNFKVLESWVGSRVANLISKPLNAQTRLAFSPLKSSRRLSQILTDHNFITDDMAKEGGVRLDYVGANIEAAYMKDAMPIITKLDEAYKTHQKAGGKMTEAEFYDNAYLFGIRGIEASDQGLSEATGAVKAYMKYMADDVIRPNTLLPEDAVLDANRIPFLIDHDKMLADPIAFKKDLANEVGVNISKGRYESKVTRLRSSLESANKEVESLSNKVSGRESKIAALKDKIQKLEKSLPLEDLNFKIAKEKTSTKISKMEKNNRINSRKLEKLSKKIENLEVQIKLKGDPAYINQEAAEIMNELSDRALGRINILGDFSARSLKMRKFDFSPEFQAKYGKTDLKELMDRYTKEIHTEAELKKAFDGESPLESSIQSINQDLQDSLDELARSKASPEKIAKQAQKLMKEAESNKQDVRDLLLMHTGRFNSGSSKTLRSINSVMSGFNTVRLLGSRVLGNASDMAYAKTKSIDPGSALSYISEHAKNIATTLSTQLTKEELKKFGLVLNDHTRALNSKGVLDISDEAILTKAERLTRKVTAGYDKIQGFDVMQNKLMDWASEGTVSNIVSLSGKLVKGEKLSLFETTTAAELGLTKKYAKQVLDQALKHGETIDGVFHTNWGHWDSEVLIPTLSKVRKDLTSALVQTTPGSAPTASSRAATKLLFQFTTWPLTSWTKITLPMLQRIGMGGQHTVRAVNRAVTDVFLAMLGGYLKYGLATGNFEGSKEKAMIYAIERSSFLGLAGTISQNLDTFQMGAGSILGGYKYSKYRAENPYRLFGPTASLAWDSAKLMEHAFHGGLTTQDYKTIKYMIPFNNYVLTNKILNDMIQEHK